jgi:phage-related protein
MARKQVVYYPDARGQTPVVECLLRLDQADQQKVFAYISYLEEQGEALRRPIADYLGGKLYELRPKQLRILYAFVGKQYAVILHAFRKKTDAVPSKEKQLAVTRLADFMQRYEKGLIATRG